MKKMLYIMMITFVFISSPHFTEAKSMKEPVVLDSDEWTLTLDNAEIDDENMTKGNEKADVYSLKIANKDGNKYNVTVHTFRKEPGKSYDFGMSVNDTDGEDVMLANKEVINFKNFPVFKEAKEFEVFIMWQEEESGRFFKQDFTVPVQ
ncbi:hypothetical protein [Halalkalibacter akibai]|uniref:Uncharacterized protein n=1 Tax=Halalkalibacter akibai (strain ATCC 43226 / DSM 21942 / CIP 109018 / JCM 9157 / 1139) TaxID=1236973 RepID=W4QXL9_HALA3|nr:hypothetical protein [Halalkalibacter akibai]GAE36652.1 hypothetical protein JCM9157_3855 [Halalkalibacter akibai JCM 9157]